MEGARTVRYASFELKIIDLERKKAVARFFQKSV